MNSSTALMIIYNHKYINNIEKIEKIYADKFSNIFHIIPFYEGNRKNVLTVFENSYFFSGYVAQAYIQLKKINQEYDSYFFIADDMILNPCINENNYLTILDISETDSFISNIFDLTSNTINTWRRNKSAYLFELENNGAQIKEILPSVIDAISLFKQKGLHSYKLSSDYYNIKKNEYQSYKSYLKDKLKYIKNKRTHLNYPLVGGYSDIFIVNKNIFEKFALYCGAFAATGLFVEIAIPTSLALTENNIKTLEKSKFHAGAIWNKNDFFRKYTFEHDKLKASLDNLEYSIENLIKNYPKDYLFLHPIKLSRWK